MRLKLNIWQINFITTFYYISLECRNNIKFFKIYEYDQNISKYLNLKVKDYKNLLKKYNTETYKDKHIFRNKEDYEKVIEELESYLVMVKLLQN